jgi:hypothetical protein
MSTNNPKTKYTNGYCRTPGCNNGIGKKRAAYGHLVCRECGEREAQAKRRLFTVVPMHKSNYFFCTDRADLVGINNKGGLVK